jgi:hypothetical protein
MSFDPWISEWGNPLDYILLLLRNNALSEPTLGRFGAVRCGVVIIRM